MGLYQDSLGMYATFSGLFILVFLAIIRVVVYVIPSPGICDAFYKEKLVYGTKLILYGTTFFADDQLHVTYLNNHLEKCPKLQCLGLTSQHRESCFDKADAIIFSPVYEDFFQAIAMFKRKRRRNLKQLWIFKSFESPLKLMQILPRGEAFYTWANGRFNLSLTYRLDSDLPAPYRKAFEKIPNATKSNNDFQTKEIFSRKRRHVAAVISACQDTWQRIHHLKELTKFGVSVDIYGKCGSLICPGRVSDVCFKQLENDYFFYASVENTICRDYVSEKFFIPMQFYMVPIVAGGGNFSLLGPPHSYVDWRDFDSPKHLADFLLHLAGNETAYASYFNWKGLYRFPDEPPYQFACNLCDVLHKQNSTSYSVLTDLKTWWLDQGRCVTSPYKELTSSNKS